MEVWLWSATNGTHQTKPYWKGARTFDRSKSAADAGTHTTSLKAPIAASSQAKNKLKAFQLSRSQPVSPQKHDGKENEVIPDSKLVEDFARHESPTIQGPSPSKAAKATSQHLPPPSTPGTRLPLAELIGNAADAHRGPAPREESPEEQLGWIPNSSNSALTPGQRRKRTHSSSPMTSSQHQAPGSVLQKEPLDIQTLQQQLKTPYADPAADLWDRYAVDRLAEDTPSGNKVTSFAHLFNEPSPAPKTPGSNGIRRWASCGNEWPTSKPKRRRIQGVLREKSDTAIQSKELDGERSLASRVGFLVDQIQATLGHPARNPRADEPSSSSPLPDKGAFERQAETSPMPKDHSAAKDQAELPTRSQDPSQHRSLQVSQHENISIPEHTKHDQPAGLQEEPADEFADEFDDDSAYVAVLDTLQPNDSASQPRISASMEAGLLETIDEDSDEFGDDAGLTLEDLDCAVPLLNDNESQPNVEDRSEQHRSADVEDVRPAAPVVLQHQTITDQQLDDDDDEFGGFDDIDEDQIAAAETAATQAYQATAPSQGSVRTFNLPRVNICS